MGCEETIERRLTGRHKMAMRLSDELSDKTILNVGCYIGWYEKFAMDNGCMHAI